MADEIKGYCSKCKQMVAIKNVKDTILRNGQAAYTGVCPNDGIEIIKKK